MTPFQFWHISGQFLPLTWRLIQLVSSQSYFLVIKLLQMTLYYEATADAKLVLAFCRASIIDFDNSTMRLMKAFS